MTLDAHEPPPTGDPSPTEAPPRRRSRRHLGIRAALGGAAVGGVLAGLLVWSWSDDARRTEGPDAATEFVEAWERSRTGTFVVVSEFRRTTDRGGLLEDVQEVVQRPPDYIVRQFGTASGRIGDRGIECEPTSAGEPTCQLVDVGLPPYDEQVAEEVARFDRYFFGSTPLYLVTSDGRGCFDLDLAQSLYPSPPYGREARFCFDAATGAPIFVEVVRDEGTDRLEAVEIRTEVTDADLDL